MEAHGDLTRALNGELEPAQQALLEREIYAQLRTLAEYQLRRERGGRDGNGTDLNLTRVVHDAWIRLSRTSTWASRAHFFGAACTAIRRVLVDEARARRRGQRRVVSGLEVEVPVEWSDPARVIAYDELLSRLRAANERWARVAEMRLFGELSEATIAEVLGVSERTVQRDWAFCRSWFMAHLDASPRLSENAPCESRVEPPPSAQE